MEILNQRGKRKTAHKGQLLIFNKFINRFSNIIFAFATKVVHAMQEFIQSLEQLSKK